jgi:hypothetical protein
MSTKPYDGVCLYRTSSRKCAFQLHRHATRRTRLELWPGDCWSWLRTPTRRHAGNDHVTSCNGSLLTEVRWTARKRLASVQSVVALEATRVFKCSNSSWLDVAPAPSWTSHGAHGLQRFLSCVAPKMLRAESFRVVVCATCSRRTRRANQSDIDMLHHL